MALGWAWIVQYQHLELDSSPLQNGAKSHEIVLPNGYEKDC